MMRLRIWWIVGLVSLFVISGCSDESNETDSTSLDAQEELLQVDLKWILTTIEDEYGTPQTEVSLGVESDTVFVDRGIAITEIPKSDWENYRIPKDAVMASGGWWAGGGSYFYVERSGNTLIVFVGYADESSSVDDAYRYEEIQRIDLNSRIRQ